MRGRRPCGLEAVSNVGEVAPEVQVELVGSREDGIGQDAAAQAVDERRVGRAAITDLRNGRQRGRCEDQDTRFLLQSAERLLVRTSGGGVALASRKNDFTSK